MDIKTIQDKLKEHKTDIMGMKSFQRYSVLLPLLMKEDEIHVLFEVRSLQLRRQPGEVCFPGGRIDEQDVSPRHTAIREATEELGINEECISNVQPLDIVISPFGTVIYPYLGVIEEEDLIDPNPSEVEEIFTVPLSFFKNTSPECFNVNFKAEPDKEFPFHLVAGGEDYNWQIRHIDEYFYCYKKYVIWGLTASIMKNFIELIEEK